MTKRIIGDVVMFACLFFAPWYWTVAVAVIFTLYFRNFWEIIFLGLALDSVYSVPGKQIYAHFGIFLVIFSIIYFSVRLIKGMIRF